MNLHNAEFVRSIVSVADCPKDGLPAISLSVGVAFSDRQDPGESVFKDADHALYYVKQHGKHGCGFYGAEQEPCAEPDAAVPVSETE